MHFPNHDRQAFHAWIDGGFPDNATMEEHYRPVELTAKQLLRAFLIPEPCTDTMPRDYCQMVADEIGWSGGRNGSAAGLTYGLAATALLLVRLGHEDAGTDFLDYLWRGDEEDQLRRDVNA